MDSRAVTGRQAAGDRAVAAPISSDDAPAPPAPPGALPGAASAAPGLWLPASSLAWREVVRFLRQRSRVVGALATPILFWVLIGSGLSRSFRPPGAETSQSYLTYFFPGSVLLLVLFTAIFSCISIIQDRSEGFLQSVLVSPAGPMAVVAGKVLGCTALAVLQGLLFLALTPLVGLRPSAIGLLHAVAILTVTSLALSAVGFFFAWRIHSVQGFHAIMNLVLMPAWLLSGALFPAAGATEWMRWLMAFNPLTYGVAALRQALDPQAGAAVGSLPSMGLCWAVLAASAIASLGIAARSVAATARRAS